MLVMTGSTFAEDLVLKLRSQKETVVNSGKFERTIRDASWSAKETAVIVCDVWDAHHCLNAVRRLEEFAPRMNDVLKEVRKRGATIIHSPSDCMAAYEDHAARKRVIAAPAAMNKPKDVEHWCSRIPSEEQAVYPIDQSDGGEDDDPAEHAEWAAKLKAMGRNPGMPWKTQSKLIEIDADRDFISDRGDEVWNLLESRGIKNVILVGVHLNMCVLGRPFGLRQMVRNGKNVALMHDMTDCMYNPKRWPHVDHFTGNDLVIAHVERFVCPTITSDQLLGGMPFRSKYDQREKPGVPDSSIVSKPDPATFRNQWSLISVPQDWNTATKGVVTEYEGVAWFRCTVRLSAGDIDGAKALGLGTRPHTSSTQFWLNGTKFDKVLETNGETCYSIPPQHMNLDDTNLLVARVEFRKGNTGFRPPRISGSRSNLSLNGRWQFRLGDDPSWSNIPLPAKFGGSTDMLFEPVR
ncbi:MAG: isochorismatase family protein [Planctomycetaceae bacterium]|nr:isochorismatase family protein [Planctomycetaceae bacterium]